MSSEFSDGQFAGQITGALTQLNQTTMELSAETKKLSESNIRMEERLANGAETFARLTSEIQENSNKINENTKDIAVLEERKCPKVQNNRGFILGGFAFMTLILTILTLWIKG